MRVGGILWGRRPPSAGGGPMLRRRPARRAGRRPWPLRPEGAERPQNISLFRRFLIANGISPAPMPREKGMLRRPIQDPGRAP
jgi:hypothetical protein